MHLRIRKRSLAEYIIFLLGLLPFFLSFMPYLTLAGVLCWLY